MSGMFVGSNVSSHVVETASYGGVPDISVSTVLCNEKYNTNISSRVQKLTDLLQGMTTYLN